MRGSALLHAPQCLTREVAYVAITVDGHEQVGLSQQRAQHVHDAVVNTCYASVFRAPCILRMTDAFE